MRRSARNGTVWLALLALGLQLALPLWHMPAFGAPMLCTAQGLRSAPVQSDDAPSAPGQAKACPVCQLAQAGGTGVLPAPTVAPVPIDFVVAPPPAAAAIWIADDLVLIPAARGPPLRA